MMTSRLSKKPRSFVLPRPDKSGPEAPASILRGTSVLIVEDDFLLAEELAGRFESAGATVIGPLSSVRDAQGAILGTGMPGAAVLKIEPEPDFVFPVADMLAERIVPFIFHGGLEWLTVPARFRNRPHLQNDDPDAIIRAVLVERAVGEALLRNLMADVADDDLVGSLPSLRLMARILIDDQAEADRLLERVLKRAIGLGGLRPDGMTPVHWLLKLLGDVWLSDPRPNPH